VRWEAQRHTAFERAEDMRVERWGDYSTFVDEYVASCDTRNPEKLREKASRIEDVGDLLEVDTNSAQESLRESADEIESEQQERPDDDDDWRGGHNSEVCSDSELDSMFGTLGN
jgi:hypothetical protein